LLSTDSLLLLQRIGVVTSALVAAPPLIFCAELSQPQHSRCQGSSGTHEEADFGQVGTDREKLFLHRALLKNIASPLPSVIHKIGAALNAAFIEIRNNRLRT
jgi:hypothetical protein